MGQKTEKIFERAKVNLEKQNHENALRLFNEVLNREPSHKKALRNKGLIKILNGSFKEAEEYLLFAVEQQPNDDHLYQMLGTLYHNNEKPKKALAQFKKAVNINKANSLAQKGLGMLYAHIFGEAGKATKHLSAAIENGSADAELYFNRGCNFMILDDMSSAEQDLRKAAELGHEKSREMVNVYFD
ncbi:MAG: tetratricopeptide repeat protein [Fodinibius sp.]|nr:tetratricopeptide repeat protein [Fodinibius sp.]